MLEAGALCLPFFLVLSFGFSCSCLSWKTFVLDGIISYTIVDGSINVCISGVTLLETYVVSSGRSYVSARLTQLVGRQTCNPKVGKRNPAARRIFRRFPTYRGESAFRLLILSCSLPACSSCGTSLVLRDLCPKTQSYYGDHTIAYGNPW